VSEVYQGEREEVTDDPDVETYDTIDEAIAAALASLSPGDTVSIHHEECEHDGESDDSCTCVPMVLTVGAEA
jgi:hypothetical protein